MDTSKPQWSHGVVVANAWLSYCEAKTVAAAVVVVAVVAVVVVVVPSDPSSARIFSDVLPNVNEVFMSISLTVRAVSCMWGRGGVGWVWWRSFALAHMFDATQQDVSCGGGVGWGGYDDVHLHLHTCLMLRNRMFHVGVGWGGCDDVHLHLHTCLMLRNRMFHVGVGWGGYDDVHLHLHTCLMLRNRMFHVGVGWGGVGMMTFICTCTHVWCYATGCFMWGWGGVGWGGYDDVHLHLHTCLMLRNRMFHVGVGWGGVGMMTFICTCTHVWCYATGCFMWGWGGVGWVWWRSFALAHMFDATQQDVSCGGGVGWGGYDDVLLHLHTCLMLRDGLPRYILYTCLQPVITDNFSFQNAMRWTASVHTLHMSTTCDNFCFQNAMRWTASVHTLHMSTTCDNFCFQNAMRWIASVHTLHMSKPVISFVVKVLRDELPRYIPHTCLNLW